MKPRWYRTFLKNWWVVAFIFMTFGFYLQAIHQKNLLVKTLQERVGYLSQEIRKAQEENEELRLRIQSWDDPEWIELVLKEHLGVAQEGETKVVFE